MIIRREDPVIVVQLASGQATGPTAEAELENSIAELDAATCALPVFALLVRSSGEGAPKTPEAVRRRWRAWLDERRERFGTSCAGVAFVASSPARAVVFRLASPLIRRMFHAPTRAFSSEPDARAWLADRLRERRQGS